MKPTDTATALCTRHKALGTLLAVVALAASVCGCAYKGAKVTEGTDLAIGMTVPGTEGMVQLNALNWLSGFRLGVAENAALTVEYTTVASNSYFGVVRTETAKRIKAKVEPCETAATPETETPAAAAPAAASSDTGFAAPAPSGATASATE